MRMSTFLKAGVALCVLGLPCMAAAETLDEALASAYQSNPTLLAQRAHLRSQDELVPQALSNWRPSVSVTGSVSRTDSYTNTSTPPGSTSTPEVVGATISEPLYRGGQTTAQTKQAEAQVQAGRAQLLSIEQTVLLNVVSAYMNVVQYQAVVELNKNNEQVLRRQMEATNDRFRVGEVTRTDVAQAESRLSAAHADLVASQGNLQVATANYVTVVGHAPDRVQAPPALGTLPVSVEAARQSALQGNPTVLQQTYSYEAALRGIDLQTGKLLPQLALSGSYSKTMNGAAFAGMSGDDHYTTKSKSIGLNLTVPIYQQGAEYSAIRQQKSVAGEARVSLDQARRDAVESTGRAWEQLQSSRARIVSYTDQIKAAQTALDGVRRESEVGSRTVLDVLNAEQEFLQARVNLVAAQHDEMVAEYTLKSAIGQLTAQSLSLPVEIYDPVKHYQEVRGKWFGVGGDPALTGSAK